MRATPALFPKSYLLAPSALLGHVLDQTQHVAGVAVLVVVPGHNLDEGVVQGDAGVDVKGGRRAVAPMLGVLWYSCVPSR